MPRTSPSRPRSAPPASAAEGAAHVRKFMVELFDRKDGHAVDWKMIAGTLFLAGFDMLDELPEDQKTALARRVHERSYLASTGESESDEPKSGKGDLGIANTEGLKSSEPQAAKPAPN